VYFYVFCLIVVLLLPGKSQFAVKLNNNSVALVRERNIPTKRLPLVGEVSANFCE
jgi:hypothetical protein